MAESDMQIGFDAKRFFNNFTGLGRYSRFVINALQEHYPQNAYWLYTPQWVNTPETNNAIDNTNVIIKKPSRWLSAMKMTSYWRSVTLGKVALRDGAQIFHGLSNELPLLPTKNLKTTVTIHDVIFKRYPQFYNLIDIKIYTLKVQKACKNADIIIAISQQTADDLYTYFGVNRDKIRIVYQGCNAIFKQQKTVQEIEATRQKYKLPATFLLTVGTIEARKNALLILNALTRLTSTSATSLALVMVGRPTKYLRHIQDYIAKNRLHDRVHILHKVALQDLPALYQMAAVFVYPSLFEGFGIPVVEAIASGTPVITSRGSCFEEAGGPYSRYIDPNDAHQLAREIESIVFDKSTQKEMIAQSQRYITRFDSGRIAQSLMNVYEELLE